MQISSINSSNNNKQNSFGMRKFIFADAESKRLFKKVLPFDEFKAFIKDGSECKPTGKDISVIVGAKEKSGDCMSDGRPAKISRTYKLVALEFKAHQGFWHSLFDGEKLSEALEIDQNDKLSAEKLKIVIKSLMEKVSKQRQDAQYEKALDK